MKTVFRRDRFKKCVTRVSVSVSWNVSLFLVLMVVVQVKNVCCYLCYTNYW